MPDIATALLLAAPGQPGTILLVGIIVTVIIGSCFLCYFALTGSAEKARQITAQSAKVEFTGDNSGPIRRYPPTGSAYLPSGVASLGESQYVHRYESIAEQCHLGWLFGSSADKYPTYISYRDAIVVVAPEGFTVIPWEEVTEFLHPVGFKASNGQKFVLTNDFTNYGPLYERFQSEILLSVLPKALAAVEAGQEWVFEPFTELDFWGRFTAALNRPQLMAPLAIGKQGIRYKDQNLAWSDVSSIQLVKHLHNGALCSTSLVIHKNWAVFASMQFDFHSVANSFLLTELLPHVCPQHLLVPAGSQGAR
ncbi:MAG: hypothetical protein L0211_05845 [Planctomycetaceae bacterium]|nr:hypothetical protein [Planctomycetaceae bacterium]